MMMNPAAATALGNEHKASFTTRKRPHDSLAEVSNTEAPRTVKSSKSRTGCGFCKQKRLKCDETKPECKNCLNRDLKCPGYKQVYQWKAKCQADARSFDATLRKKTGLPRSTATRRRPRSKQTHVDGSEDEISQEVEEHNACNANAPDGREMQHVGFGHCEALNSHLDFAGIDLDGLSIDEMMAKSQCTDPSVPGLLPDESLVFPLDCDSMSDYNHSSDSFRTYTHQLYVPAEMSITDPTRESSDNEPITTVVSPSTNAKRRDIRGLLSKFYATSPSVPFPLVHHATKLVEHYFSTICGIYSCFDSFLNPFRYTVSESWTRSASTYYAIQSMAAAHLANELPHLRTEGINFHRKASQHLGQELQMVRSGQPNDDQALLSLLLLGMSACWQRSGDLGLPYLRTARSVMYKTLARRDRTNASTMRPLLQFFEEALIYWEMVTSFVADEVEIDVLQPTLLDGGQAGNLVDAVDEEPPLPQLPPMAYSSELLPHPWTGVSPESQMLLGQVGRLVRRARVRDRFLNDETHLFGLALELEESLLEATTPSTSSMTDCGDFVTQTTDFVTLAETTRDAGLLELYRVFPALLKRRLGLNDEIIVGAVEDCIPDTTSQCVARSWLTSLAVRILRRLESIPESSNVRCHQLLLIVIAAAELRVPSMGKADYVEFSELDSELDLEVLWGRQFARTRLHQLAVQLPSQPVYTIMELISEVWKRQDASSNQQSDDTFWIDVMVEKGWHTIMG